MVCQAGFDKVGKACWGCLLSLTAHRFDRRFAASGGRKRLEVRDAWEQAWEQKRPSVDGLPAVGKLTKELTKGVL